MGWDGHDFGIFTVSTDSHGGERERMANEQLENLRKDIADFIAAMEKKYNIDGVIRLYA